MTAQGYSLVVLPGQTVRQAVHHPVAPPEGLPGPSPYTVLPLTITCHDRLLYFNDTAFAVLTQGHLRRGVDMWVVVVGGE